MEDGSLLVEEKLYMILRSNGFITVASKHNSEDMSEEIDEYAQKQEERRIALLSSIQSTRTSLIQLQKTSEELVASQKDVVSSQQQSLRMAELEKLRMEVTQAEQEVEEESVSEVEDIAQLEASMQCMKVSREQCGVLREALRGIEKGLEDKREELLRTKVSSKTTSHIPSLLFVCVCVFFFFF
jgi:Fe2+ transport system protein B